MSYEDLDLYDELGVSPGASADEIKKAYRKQAMMYHTDTGGSEEQMKKINHAFEILGNSVKRTRYDAERNLAASQASAGSSSSQSAPPPPKSSYQAPPNQQQPSWTPSGGSPPPPPTGTGTSPVPSKDGKGKKIAVAAGCVVVFLLLMSAINSQKTPSTSSTTYASSAAPTTATNSASPSQSTAPPITETPCDECSLYWGNGAQGYYDWVQKQLRDVQRARSSVEECESQYPPASYGSVCGRSGLSSEEKDVEKAVNDYNLYAKHNREYLIAHGLPPSMNPDGSPAG